MKHENTSDIVALNLHHISYTVIKITRHDTIFELVVIKILTKYTCN